MPLGSQDLPTSCPTKPLCGRFVGFQFIFLTLLAPFLSWAHFGLQTNPPQLPLFH